MWPFDKKEDQISLPAPKGEELISMAEDLNKRGLVGAIESSMQKQIDSSQYYQMYENADDSGNYFGSEFNIRATAGRIKQTYLREPWIYATSSLIARTLSSIKYKVVNVATGEIDDKHPLNDKLVMGSRMNDHESSEWNGNLDLVLAGNHFRVFNDTFTECVQYPAELVQLKISDVTKQVESLLIYDQQRQGYGTVIPYKQVVHHKYPNPFNPFYGMSIYTAASRPILLDRYKNEFEMAFYLRGATNAGVIETTEDINKQRMERLMRTFEAIYTGKRNWWRTIFLPKGAKWVNSGLTMSEMQHLEGLRENRLTLLAVLGIPPSQVGVVQDVNRSTSEIQERNFWNNTIKPMAVFNAGGWNNSYLVKYIYGGLVRVEPDFSDIEALQGSLITKGEQAKSVMEFLWIDEIRKDILGYDPLPNNAGQKFVAEVKGAGQPFGAPQAALAAPQGDPITEVAIATEVPNQSLAMKAQAIASQDKIENKLTTDYLGAYGKYLDELFTYTEQGLRDGVNDMEKFLEGKVSTLARTYMKEAEPILAKAQDRGFSFAASQSKALTASLMVGKMQRKRVRFSDVDQQAIDALKNEQADGKRTTLARRSLDSFLGFNENRSKEVLNIIAENLGNGTTIENIAAILRSQYAERYKNQAFTIARTELLTAISQGMKWNHDILGEVFTDVKKQWYHVGDVASNPDARDWHLDYELAGPKPKDYKYGGVLEYPRDPSGSAGDNINCRCSMVSVIPDGASSNAEVILDKL
jgi:HK97 family phage portal protein